ncbi:MAG TPA: BTAD domain-containing putative transcriptional regulator [Arthrobacter sp.]|nr:BTAD domain-containing putative transcriptional regulator [Arthrobacter sp.]
MSASEAQSVEGFIHVKVLGELQVRRGDTVLRARDFGGCKPRQILEILVLQQGTPVSKDRLIDLLWGDAAPPEALATLESYISILRRRIQPGRGKTGPLRTVTAGYVIDRTLVDLDLDRFNILLEKAGHAPAAEAYPQLLEALAVAAEPLLGHEPSAEWADSERHAHNSRLAWAMVAASNAANGIGKSEEAVQLARRAITVDQLDEAAWCALLTGLGSNGRQAEALHAYEQCRNMFIEELGCAPGPSLQKIHRDLLQGVTHSDDALGDLISALLCLHAHTTPARPGTGKTSGYEPLRDASRVLSKLLKQAQLAMQSPA